MRIRKTKDNYEEYLNDLFYGEDLTENDRYSYLRAPILLRRGKLGTALRKHDPIAFNTGFDEWQPHRM